MSMDYELAKQLKDVGFAHSWCSEDDCSCLTNGDSSKGTMCFPSLEELIEACGEKFCTLSFAPERDLLWVAMPRLLKIDVLIREHGSTPTEAVARLWLALNPPTQETK